MYFVYILKSEKDDKYYVGSSGRLKERIEEHKLGKVKSTKHRRPLHLVCYEAYANKVVAQRREKYLKSSDGHKDIKCRF